MNHAEFHYVSPHLLAEYDRLCQAIEDIRRSGTVAPACCWLIESSETKRGRTYTYVKRVTEQPGSKPTSKSLGKPGGEKHQMWQAAIGRREQIAELEQQLKQLKVLIDRQEAFHHLFVRD